MRSREWCVFEWMVFVFMECVCVYDWMVCVHAMLGMDTPSVETSLETPLL